LHGRNLAADGEADGDKSANNAGNEPNKSSSTDVPREAEADSPAEDRKPE
jgi:hypothetical protein